MTVTAADFASPEAAGARLSALQADSMWGNRVMLGDKDTLAEFNSLSRVIAGLPADYTPPARAADMLTGAGEDQPGEVETIGSFTGGPHGIRPDLKQRLAVDLLAHGESSDRVAEMFNDARAYTAQDHEMARMKWAELSTNPEFVRDLFNGVVEATRLWRAHATVVSGGVRK